MSIKRQTNIYTAFEGVNLLFQGELSEVILKVKTHLGSSENSSVLIFSDETGKSMDFNFHGSKQDVLKRLETFTTSDGVNPSNGPGRPRLGVVSREVSLLPNHWEWLATQDGGASATLRRLVEEARKKFSQSLSIKQIQERVYRVMSVLMGDYLGYEEALRALYKRDLKTFQVKTQNWPKDVREYLTKMSKLIFDSK